MEEIAVKGLQIILAMENLAINTTIAVKLKEDIQSIIILLIGFKVNQSLFSLSFKHHITKLQK